MNRVLLALLLALVLVAPAGCGSGSSGAGAKHAADPSLDRVKKAGVLVWGADVIGGIPYAFEDPKHPGTYVGFEVDIAREVARQLGVQPKLVIRAWDTLVPELQKGSFDMAMNGIEDTPDRAAIVAFSDPYFVYSQQLTVREGTSGVTTLADLKGKTVATLSGTAAEDILRQTAGIKVVTHPEIIYSYRDLQSRRVDAVLLDSPIAAAYGASNPRLKNVGESFGEGQYVAAFRKEDQSLRAAVNAALENLKRDGKLKAIYAKWGILDKHQARIGIL
jgi:polar amino acid transport system permease protein/polar amino acid transport system substrate-binding protein